MNSVLVTVPVHNEAAMLQASFDRLVMGLQSSGLVYTLSIAEDGSSDGTLDVIANLRVEHPGLVISTDPIRRGRGWALRKIWSQFDADVYVFVDADLAAGPESLVRVVDMVLRGADVATGSRYCEGAVVRRPPLRNFVSLGYNWLVRILFGDEIRDHQCGLKAFTRAAKAKLLEMTWEDSWAWDTEMLVMADRLGMRVVEVPVEWTEYRVARTPILRLVSDVILHGGSLLRLKSRIRGGIEPGIRSPPSSLLISDDSTGPQGKGSGFSR